MEVGGYKVDILAKESDTTQLVVIENQLEPTNHKHLGQVLTYASGYDARAVVWIAKKISEEHRKALDWLNSMTLNSVVFFGLEMELWKIGNSAPAPKFNLVSQPNDWARTLKASSSRGDGEPTETKLLQKEFWTEMVKYFQENNTRLATGKCHPRHWYTIAVGRSGFHLSLTLNSQQKRIGCELYMQAPTSKPAFEQLFADKDEIEKELVAKLEWRPLPRRGASRIIQYRVGTFEDRDLWPELIQWFRERAESFHSSFSKRVISLDLEDDEPV